jgi:uncharacterized protein (DUF885 family)
LRLGQDRDLGVVVALRADQPHRQVAEVAVVDGRVPPDGDTGIHAKGWTREQAIDYMLARLSLSRSTVEGEVDRYIAMPAQALGYQIGNLKFRALHARAQSRLGERFDVRAYHDQLMAAGAVTLPVLEEVVDDWLARH